MNDMIIDSHAHLSSDQLVDQVEGILARAEQAKLSHIVNICTDERTLTRGLALAEKYPWVHNTAATTPHDVEKEGESFFPFVEKVAQEGRLVAIGETGLDYFYEHSPRELQQHYLVRYFGLAKRSNLPVIIHCRDAFEDLFRLADEHYKGLPLLLHCFTGGVDEVEEAVKRGWMISLSGIVTFKKSVILQEVAKKIPFNRLLVETDTPYLAPQRRRGQINEPAFIVETIEMIAELRQVSFEEVVRATSANASQFFLL